MLNRFFNEKGTANSTQKHYKASVKLYEKVTGLTLNELLTEADNEETEKIPWNRAYLIDSKSKLRDKYIKCISDLTFFDTDLKVNNDRLIELEKENELLKKLLINSNI